MRATTRFFFAATLFSLGCGGQVDSPGVDESGEGYTYQCSGGNTVRGVDVSSYQGLPDWNAVHASGRQFGFAKATEATGFHDGSFAHNWAGIRAAGMVRGAYHFLRANIDGAVQADYFVDFVNANGGFGPGDLAMIDVETTDGQSGAGVANAVAAFLNRVRARTGKNAVIYTGLSFWQNTIGNPSFSSYPLFIADYDGLACPYMPTSWPRWTLWQYGSTDRVPGIAGNVDGDLFNGTVGQLAALAAGNVATNCNGHTTQGQIAIEYASLGGCSSFLGGPVTDETATPDGVGRYNHFQNGGSIYWTPQTGAHEVHGDIHALWSSLGWERSALGYPLTDETGTPDGVGRYNHFQNGSIYWTPQLGAHEVGGAIFGEWAQLGWERSVLGYPTTDETGTPDGVGRYNHFQYGSIYFTPSTGAHEVHGNIQVEWSSLGWERSALGYPISDETGTPDGVGRYNHFQNGSIYWTPSTGAHALHGAIGGSWAQMGFERSPLGYPTSDEYAVTGGSRQDFQHGSLLWSAATGAVTQQ
jgi:uncharacterized protein with LGFP repeats